MTLTKSVGILLSTLFALSVPLHAEQAAKLPKVEDFFANEDVRDARISPSGKHIAWLQKNEAGRFVLMTADTSEPQKLSRAAGYSNADVAFFRWVNDERLFLWISDVSQANGFFNNDEYAVNRDGSMLRQISSTDWNYHQERTGSQIKTKVLPPEYFYYAPTHDGSDDVIVRHTSYNNVDYSDKHIRLYRLNTKTLQLTDASSGNLPAEMLGWVLDRDSKPRIGIDWSKGRKVIYYNDPTKNEWRKLGDFDSESGEGFTPDFFNFDGGLYATGSDGHGYTALYKYRLGEDKLAADPLLSVKGYDFRGAPIFDYTARKMVGIRYENDAWNTAWLDPKMREMQQKVDAFLPNTVNSIDCNNCLAAPAVLVNSDSDRQPTRYYVYDTQKNVMTMLGGELPNIDARQMGERSVEQYKTHDGMTIPVYVTTPAHAAKGPLPTVVIVHGGPWIRGSSWEWNTEAQFLASRGYLVIQPEFRGSRGYGFNLFHAGWGEWGLSMQNDIADATKWAITKGLADPKRIAISGASYGGYATLMGLIRNPELFRAGFEFAGVTDIDLMFTSAEADSSLDDLNYDMRTLIGDPKADAKKFKENSAVANAALIKQPVLLAYGGRDHRVPMVHGTEFRNAITRTNQDVEWLDYPNEAHGFRFEDDRIDYYKHVEAFLAKNLAPVN